MDTIAERGKNGIGLKPTHVPQFSSASRLASTGHLAGQVSRPLAVMWPQTEGLFTREEKKGKGDLRKNWVQVPDLLRHLPGDLIGAHGVFVSLLAEAKVEASKDEGEGDAEPHAQQGQHGGEGNGS